MHIYSLVYVYACVCVCAYLVHICVRAIVASLCYLIMSTSMVILWHIYHVWHLCVKGYIYLFVYVNGLCVIWFRGISFRSSYPPGELPHPPPVLYTLHYLPARGFYTFHSQHRVWYIFSFTRGVVCVCLFVCARMHVCTWYLVLGILIVLSVLYII